MKPILIEISPGELIDRLSILQLKAQHLPAGPKQADVQDQLAKLQRLRQQMAPPSAMLHELSEQLAAVNQKLWRVEDELRICEKSQEFTQRFIDLARSVYRLNDQRCALKQRINQLLGSAAGEQKVYA